MELYILDTALRRAEVIDRFESFIWTERWREFGDFELKVPSTSENRSLFKSDMWVTKNNSWRIMEVEAIEDTVDDSGVEILLIKGRSIEKYLQDRIFSPTHEHIADGTTSKFSSNNPRLLAELRYRQIIVELSLSSSDGFPFVDDLLSKSVYSSVPNAIFDHSFDSLAYIQVDFSNPPTLYDVITHLCDAYDMGFRFTRNHDKSEIFFNVYYGNDRTTDQTENPPVIFSMDLDNFYNTRQFTSITNEKTTGILRWEPDPDGFPSISMISATRISGTPAGWNRKVMFVPQKIDVSGLSASARNSAIRRRVREELKRYKPVHLFDGEVGQNNYIYDVDYRLGDRVEIRDRDGNKTHCRVIEQIFTEDNNGEHVYPTLSYDEGLMRD